MRVLEVIPYRVWEHKESGRRVSIYSAKAWPDAENDQWELVTRGWTWKCDNGTTGLGRVPAKTKEDAEQVMRDWNGRRS